MLYLLTGLLFCYLGFRIWFCLLYFKDLPAGQIAQCFLWGTRSDYTFLFFLNLPVWLYLLVVNPKARYSKQLNTIVFISFLFVNFVFFLISFVDLFYYRFNFRRSTADLLYVLKDSGRAITGYLVLYKIPLIFFLIIAILFFLAIKRTLFSDTVYFKAETSRHRWYIKGVFFSCAFFLAWGRGPKPFLPVDLYLYLPQNLQPLASNSGFSISYSILKKQTYLTTNNFYTDQQLDELFTLNRTYKKADGFTKKNVVVFILESFSRSFLYPGGKAKAYTPFLDSLINRSVVCRNSYANAFESNKGIVAILGAMPTFTEEPYYYSVYASNKIDGIGHRLSRQGYQTSFFMGANNDHFGFAKWCKIIGINNYFSAEDYPDQGHHDGQWGISDHYFLPYAANAIKQQKPPFFSAIFNLSSHIPFSIPKELKKSFSIPGQNPQQNVVSYVDYSLRLFFEEIREEPWYANTVFVFTADHASYYYGDASLIDYTEVPIFYHIPAGEGKTINKPVQQIDIVPTILDLLHYPESFNSFGRSAFDTSSQQGYFKLFDNYYIRDTSLLLGLSEKTNIANQLYDLRTDRAMKNNLLHNKSYDKQKVLLEQQLKAFVQRYTTTLNRNSLTEE